MFASFEGKIESGRLVVPELGDRPSILEGKHLAITPLELDKENHIVGGMVLAGTYSKGELKTLGSKQKGLQEFNGRNVLVIIRHAIMGRVTGEVFDKKYQLGAKLGDMDD